MGLDLAEQGGLKVTLTIPKTARNIWTQTQMLWYPQALLGVEQAAESPVHQGTGFANIHIKARLQPLRRCTKTRPQFANSCNKETFSQAPSCL